jgi:regulator of replication initiation timing
MRKAQTFAKKVTEWDLLNNNIKPHLAEMPYLQEIVTGLETLIAEAKTLDAEQEAARGRLQDMVQRRQEVEKEGEALRSRVASHLRGSFGFTSNDLVKFGVRPRRTGPRGPRKAKTPAEQPAASA